MLLLVIIGGTLLYTQVPSAYAAEVEDIEEFKAQVLESNKTYLSKQVELGIITQEEYDNHIARIVEHQLTCNGTGINDGNGHGCRDGGTGSFACYNFGSIACGGACGVSNCNYSVGHQNQSHGSGNFAGQNGCAGVCGVEDCNLGMGHQYQPPGYHMNGHGNGRNCRNSGGMGKHR